MSLRDDLLPPPAERAERPAAPPGGDGPRRRDRRRGHGLRVALAAVAAGGAVTVAGFVVADPTDATPVLGPGLVHVEVGIHHSRFDLGTLRVREGTVLEIVVRNGDPIDHELVIGTEEVHRRHRAGTERRHPPIPGEVSIAPGDTALTFYEVTEPGTVEYACHLPGHERYGMRGTIEVVPAP